MILQLYDAADGIRGHYCVGRNYSSIYHEWWNEDKFCSAGELFIGYKKAKKALMRIAKLTNSEYVLPNE